MEDKNGNTIYLCSYASGDGAISFTWEDKKRDAVSHPVTKEDIENYPLAKERLKNGWKLLNQWGQWKMFQDVKRHSSKCGKFDIGNELILNNVVYSYHKSPVTQQYEFWYFEGQTVIEARNFNITGALKFFLE